MDGLEVALGRSLLSTDACVSPRWAGTRLHVQPERFRADHTPDIALVRDESVTFLIDGEMNIPCDDPTSCTTLELTLIPWHPLGIR